MKIIKKTPAVPEDLNDRAQDHWRTLVPCLVKAGAVTQLDLPVLAMACEIYVKCVDSETPEAMGSYLKLYMSIVEKYGATPKGRKAMAAAEPKVKKTSRYDIDAELKKDFE